MFLENETHTLLLTEGNMFHLSRKLDEIQSLTLSGSEGRGVTAQLLLS